jgi:D-3-phosphoglycerate dehydrogenase
MHPESFFINAARGDVVDENALLTILKEEKIAGAGLDVFAEEPLPADSPFIELDKLILLPHNAALTKECTGRMSLHAAMGIDEVLSGKEPTWPVNKPKNRRS